MALATWRDVGGAWKIAALARWSNSDDERRRIHARPRRQGHRRQIAEVMRDLTPESMAQLGPLMAGGPNPAEGKRSPRSARDGDDYIFDVTYTGDGDAKTSMRETVRQVDGKWKIVAKLAGAFLRRLTPSR